jgi:signal transduction histidine kinase
MGSLGMSGNLLLDWAVLTVSLFNTVTLLWLGLTVLLNAERRTPGLWVAGGMLLLGSLFFLSHSAILGQASLLAFQEVNFWWRLGWFPVVFLPFAWYSVMLWYSGYWSHPQSRLHRRHRIWFWFSSVILTGITGMLFFANPLPDFPKIGGFNLISTPSLFGIPLLVLIYPIYIFLCISLSLEVLRQPAHSERVMGEIARQRARPWLAWASGLELVVCLLVGWAMLTIVNEVQDDAYIPGIAHTITWFDLAIASLIAVTIILAGQAISSYEVFTGKALPRRGLRRYWQRVLVLAAGYGALVSLGWVLPLHPIYVVLVSTVLITVFYALLGWRSFEERERSMQNLRPFVTSQRLFDQLSLGDNLEPTSIDRHTPWQALCKDVLGASIAYLVPLGSLAALAGPPLSYPQESSSIPSAGDTSHLFKEPKTLCIALDPQSHAGASWAVPLWSERGLVGTLMLGEKVDGSLYAQEEIEIARVTGERLVDGLAGSEIARRLMALQRQKLTESRVLDWQTRRTLHDDVLPELHAAMLTLGECVAPNDAKSSQVMESLSEVHQKISSLLRELPSSTPPELSRYGLVGGLKQVITNEFKNSFDHVNWEIDTNAEKLITSLPVLAMEVLFYAGREAMRNAARHARREGQPLILTVRVFMPTTDSLEISLEDNGVGITAASTNTNPGGQGLALHSTLMAVIGGTLEVESSPSRYTRVSLELPINRERAV